MESLQAHRRISSDVPPYLPPAGVTAHLAIPACCGATLKYLPPRKSAVLQSFLLVVDGLISGPHDIEDCGDRAGKIHLRLPIVTCPQLLTVERTI